MNEEEIFERAHAEVVGLCRGERRWTMRVPVDESSDSDMVIGAAIRAGEELLAERDALRAENAELRLQINRLEGRLEEAYTDLRERTGEVRDLRALLDDRDRTKMRLDNRIEDLYAEVERLKATPTPRLRSQSERVAAEREGGAA